MATLEQIETAIRNAHAAGDGEAVRKLAAAREQLKKPADLNEVTAGFARESEHQQRKRELAQNTQGAADAGAGMMEGGRLLKAGVKQAAADVQDFYGLMVHGKPSSYDKVTRDETGKVIKREQGLLDDSKSLPVIAQELVRQQVQTEVDRDRGINIGARDTAAGAVQLGALALGPEAALPRATTLSRGMLKNSVSNVAGTALTFDADQRRGSDLAIAAGAGPVLATVTGLVPATKNAIGRALQRVSTGTRTAAARDSAQAVLPNVEYSLAQRTGVPELVTLERRAFNDQMQNFYADQTDKFVGDVVTALKQPMKAGQTIENDFTAARVMADRSLKALKLNASNGYERGITEANNMASRVTKGGALAPVPTPELSEALQSVMAQAEKTKDWGAGKVLPDQFLRKAAAASQGGQLAPKDLADMLVVLTKFQKDTKNPVGQALASRIRGALDNDLDKLDAMRDTPSMPQLDDSVNKILDTRAEYRRAMQAADVLGESAAYKLLGVGEEGAEASDLLAKLKGMNPDKRNSVRTFMELNSPDLLVSMKDAAVRDAVARAGTIRPAADSQQSLGQLTDALFDSKAGFDVRTSGIWNADELKKLDGIKNGLRTIANNRPNMGGAGTPITPEDTAINLISQHSAFVARYVTRALMASEGSRFFTDPRIYERMTKINRTTTGSASNLAARASLLDLLQTDYSEDGTALEPSE